MSRKIIVGLFTVTTLHFGRALLAAEVTALWTGNSDATESISATQGTPAGNLSFAMARFGQGMRFDGNTYITVPASAVAFHGEASFAIAAWVWSTNPAPSQTILSLYQGENSFEPSAFGFGLNNGRMSFYLRDNAASEGPTGQFIRGTRNAADGQFHRLVMVRDVTAGRALLYLDGQLETSAALLRTASGPITLDRIDQEPLVIGATFPTIGTGFRNLFAGIVDELVLLTGAPTPAEIAADYQRFELRLHAKRRLLEIELPGNIATTYRVEWSESLSDPRWSFLTNLTVGKSPATIPLESVLAHGFTRAVALP